MGQDTYIDKGLKYLNFSVETESVKLDCNITLRPNWFPKVIWLLLSRIFIRWDYKYKDKECLKKLK